VTNNVAAKPVTFLPETNHVCTAELPTCIHQKSQTFSQKSQILDIYT